MQQPELERSRVMLDLLESVDRDSGQSQRSMASQFGVALGLVNAYLKICIKKGYVKVRRMPAQRYAYLLTPKGISEKSRLTLVMLSNQLELFRRARADYSEVFANAKALGWTRIVLVGATELAEISAICALEAEIEIAAILDPALTAQRFIGLQVVSRLEDVPGAFDGVLITDVLAAHLKYAAAVAQLGKDRVLGPIQLGFAPVSKERAA